MKELEAVGTGSVHYKKKGGYLHEFFWDCYVRGFNLFLFYATKKHPSTRGGCVVWLYAGRYSVGYQVPAFISYFLVSN